jgi:hypothetical protein
MFSERKLLIRFSETLAGLGAVAVLFQAGRTYVHPPEDYPAFIAASVCMIGVMLTFLPVCILGGEYVRTVRKPTTNEEHSDGLSSAELSFMVRWAPTAHKVGAWLGLVILVGTLLTFGEVTIPARDPTSPRDIPALYLYFSVFYLLSLPVLGSASRMPGSYATNSDA